MTLNSSCRALGLEPWQDCPFSVQDRWELPFRDRYTFRSSVLPFHYLLLLICPASIDPVFPELSGWLSRREQGGCAAVHRDVKACLGWSLTTTTTALLRDVTMFQPHSELWPQTSFWAGL